MTPPSGRVVAAIQARMTSGRLPGKTLVDLDGRPMLEVVLRRVRRASSVGHWVVATSDGPADDGIAALVRSLGVQCFRGSEDDVLDRLYRAVTPLAPTTVVRLTGDNPFVDGSFVDDLVGEYHARGCDYLISGRASYPVGLSVEVFSFAGLHAAWSESRDPRCREHVTPFLYTNPDRFRAERHDAPRDDSDLRLTVDSPEDLELARRVLGHFGHDEFGWREAVAVLRARPDWAAINRGVHQRGWSEAPGAK